MALISQDIKNLVSGVSQQPDVLRHAEQLESQLNGWSSEVGGLQKRPPTTHIASLIEKLYIEDVDTENKPLIHFINRDDFEQYVVMFDGYDIKVWDLEGNPQTVLTPEGMNYVLTPEPRRDLRMVTIADYTFIVNTTKTVRMSNATPPDAWINQGALVNIKSGQYGRTYRIHLNGTDIATFTTPDGSDKSHTVQIATDYIVDKLYEGAVNNGYICYKGPSWLYITKSEETTITKKYWREPSRSYEQEVAFLNHIPGVDAKYTKTWFLAGDLPERCAVGKVVNGDIASNAELQAEFAAARANYWDVHIITSKGFYMVRRGFWETVEEPNTQTAIKSLEVYDGFNNQGAIGILKTVQKFSLLPTSAPNGFVVKVAGESGSTTDDYYVRYNAEGNIWEECQRPGVTLAFDLESMPHVLKRTETGAFSFEKAEWAERETGDDDSNPEPSFVGQKISDIYFHKNRLGFVSGENVILTRTASFFNFWIASAQAIQDTDPIDLAVSDNKIDTIHYAVPYDEDLVLFSDDAQFMLQSDGALTPKDAMIPPAVTRFGSSKKAKPVAAGRNLYFTAERSTHTTIREFFTAADNTDSKDAQDITAHTPNYIPNGVYKIVPSGVENVLLFFTEGEENAIYVYKYLFIDSVKQQAAWSKWDLQGRILGAEFVDSYLYLVIQRESATCLERISFAYNTQDFPEEPYRIYLDRKVTYVIPAGSYKPETDTTEFPVNELFAGAKWATQTKFCILSTEGLITYTYGNRNVVLQGFHEGDTVIAGLPYMFKIQMSTVMLKQVEEGRTQAITEGRLQLKYITFKYSDTGYFKVRIIQKDKGTYESVFTARIMGTSSNLLDTVAKATGEFRVPVHSVNTNCIIEVETIEPNPVALMGANWQAEYNRRTRQF